MKTYRLFLIILCCLYLFGCRQEKQGLIKSEQISYKDLDYGIDIDVALLEFPGDTTQLRRLASYIADTTLKLHPSRLVLVWLYSCPEQARNLWNSNHYIYAYWKKPDTILSNVNRAHYNYMMNRPEAANIKQEVSIVRRLLPSVDLCALNHELLQLDIKMRKAKTESERKVIYKDWEVAFLKKYHITEKDITIILSASEYFCERVQGSK